MENLTNSSEEAFTFRRSIWIANLAVSSLLSVVSIYIFAALVYHDIKVLGKRNEKFFQLSLEKKFAVISRYICILIAFISLIRNVNSVGLSAMEKEAITSNLTQQQTTAIQRACEVTPRIGISAVTLGTGLVYLFLWFRQRVFYVHPSMKVLNNKLVRGTSLGVIVVWCLYYIPLTLCYFILIQYVFSPKGGCLVVGSTSMMYLYLIVSWTIVSVLMQIALLGLFIFPIIKRALWGSKETSHNSILLQRVRKAIVITLVCLLSDIISAAITWATNQPNATSFFTIYSLNLTVNHLAAIACFDYWKTMLWPWKMSQNHYTSPSKTDISHSASGFQTRDQKTKLTLNAPASP